jgi:cytochrome c oxidase subunit 1
MTTLDEPRQVQIGSPASGAASPSNRKSRGRVGAILSWVSTTDHKRIGILYGASALLFFLLAGVEALLLRLQLARPDGQVLGADAYNQIFTMHGTTMIFLVVVPLGAAFGNYLVPLQIGARDVAFPRMNALSFWLFLGGGIILNTSFFTGGAPDGGWFMYAPNSGNEFSPTDGVTYWALGLLVTGIASIVGAINLIVTTLNMRAKGMSLMRLPIFSWMSLVTSFLVLFALTVLSVALYMLLFDRRFGATFFDVEQGADPLLWQHLFWLFGHPEVYLMILPSFGIISEILPTFSRKPLFGYPFIVFSGAAIGFVGWGVWAHHMFASGIGPVSVAVFAISTMAIAVPTGVKIINWILTMWGGKLWFSVPMLFAIGEVSMFMIGGLSGVTHAVAPSNTQQTDTYYVVAHFHYVLFGGALFGFVAGIYYWWPKVFGRILNETLGYWHFWLMLIGFNLTFGPQHVLGLQGQPRRMYTYTEARAGEGFFNISFWNLMSTIGAFVIALSFVVFLANIVRSRRNFTTEPDPWDARSLEWMTATPVPAWNYSTVPTVHALDEFWHRKYGKDDDGTIVRELTGAEVVARTESAEIGRQVVLPLPTYKPLVLSVAVVIAAYGFVTSMWVTAIGVVLAIFALMAWVLSPCFPPDAHHGPPPTDIKQPLVATTSSVATNKDQH